MGSVLLAHSKPNMDVRDRMRKRTDILYLCRNYIDSKKHKSLKHMISH